MPIQLGSIRSQDLFSKLRPQRCHVCKFQHRSRYTLYPRQAEASLSKSQGRLRADAPPPEASRKNPDCSVQAFLIDLLRLNQFRKGKPIHPVYQFQCSSHAKHPDIQNRVQPFKLTHKIWPTHLANLFMCKTVSSHGIWKINGYY